MLREVPYVRVHLTSGPGPALGAENPKKKLSDSTWGAPSLRLSDWKAVRSSVGSGEWKRPQPLVGPEAGSFKFWLNSAPLGITDSSEPRSPFLQNGPQGWDSN